ncbi:MAG: molybdopterin-guanine dinucleotide biosynthesis protein B [Deltaproteobacteria bacterium]|nr:molybdopterin-guanine dinucleotide biosynthesis protein B [Candidatus Anaeroferrophillus wilburensis]MBN2888437.1 molybdopterin-guanine dinucleotide biosynthesis protein B [Deltaproteobacteria bacterium]
MSFSTPPIICLVGTSNSGKTTLLTTIITELKGLGYRVGTIKHHQHTFSIDQEGKDSWRHRQAGADTTVITAPSQTAIIKQTTEQMELQQIATNYLNDMDIVLIEGFKNSTFPKIEVHRQAQRANLICRGPRNDQNLIAVASDQSWDIDVPVFPLDSGRDIADFIINYLNLNPAT